MASHQSTKAKSQQVSDEFKTLTQQVFRCYGRLTSSYKPSLVEIEYLGDCLTPRADVKTLFLERIIFTVETGSYLGKLLSSSQIDSLHINIRSDGELALIREMRKVKKYFFSGSCTGFDIDFCSLTHSLNKFLTQIEFKDNIITDDGLKMVLGALKVKMTESKKYNYTLRWYQSTDPNALGLDELFECVENKKLTVFSSGDTGHTIKVENTSQANSFFKIKVDYNHIKTDNIKQFLNKHKNKNLVVKINAWDKECIALMSMVDIMKDLPMKLIVSWYVPFVSVDKVNEIMANLIKTNLYDLTIDIKNLTSDAFQIIFDKLKNIKLQNLRIISVELCNFNPQIVVKPLEITGLNFLCIQECKLNNELSKEIFLKLENSNLETLELIRFHLNTKLANALSKSLIRCNLTKLRLRYCDLQCEEMKIIAKALKDTKITFIDLTGNKIKNTGVKAIANVVEKTKLNTLILDYNDFNATGAIELLKSIQKTKIVNCYMYDCKYIDGSFDAIANILKDNKILLNCIEKGKNIKIDEYIERNNLLKKANS